MTSEDAKKIQELKVKLQKDYDDKMVNDLVDRYKTPGKLMYDFPFLRQCLYAHQKSMFAPGWTLGLDYRIALFDTHDQIIEECTGYASYKLHDRLLYKLNENLTAGVPLHIQLKFFQSMMKGNSKLYNMDDIMKSFSIEFIPACRHLYAESNEFKKQWDAGKIEIGSKL